MLPDQPNVTLSSSQYRVFQFVDQMLLTMEPFASNETDDDIEQTEPIMVSLFNFWHTILCFITNTKLHC